MIMFWGKVRTAQNVLSQLVKNVIFNFNLREHTHTDAAFPIITFITLKMTLGFFLV